MHKLESFALSSASKIDKPFVYKKFFPVNSERFICISQDSLSPSQSYDYFDDIIFHIKPFLDKENIQIFEIGDPKNKKLFHTNQIKGLDIHQYAYILSKCEFYVGNLNLFSHICGSIGKDIFALCNNTYKESAEPYWLTPKSIVLYPNSKVKPIFTNTENPKTINDINPELIACKILDFLDINHSLSKIETIHLGENYSNQYIDILPDQNTLPSIKFDAPANIRLDKHYNLNFLHSCKHLKDFSITTDKVIPPQSLLLIKDNLKSINFIISKQTKLSEIQILESLGKPVNLSCKDTKNINDIRLNFLDHTIHLSKTFSKKDLKVRNLKDLKFLSKKNIFYKNNLYNSYLSIALNQNTTSVKNQKEFWEDLPFLRIYKESS